MTSPSAEARTAAVFYVATTALGASAFIVGGRFESPANLVAAVFYLVVTALFFRLFAPVSMAGSALAAISSVAGCGIQILESLHLHDFHINNIIFFGFYCLLIAWLILRSTFLPHVLAAFMALAGLCWLTYLSPHLGHWLSSYTFVLGLVGEGALTFWLLVRGVDAKRWWQQAQG